MKLARLSLCLIVIACHSEELRGDTDPIVGAWCTDTDKPVYFHGTWRDFGLEESDGFWIDNDGVPRLPERWFRDGDRRLRFRTETPAAIVNEDWAGDEQSVRLTWYENLEEISLPLRREPYLVQRADAGICSMNH